MELTRQSIFSAAARKLRQDFSELSATIPHRGVKGDEAVRLVRSFLNDHLPKRFNASSGFIIDRRDQVSKQTDVVVYDALNCPVYRTSDEAGIFPADNVAAVVEVKSRLDGEKFAEAAENIRAAKSLVKEKADPSSFVKTQTLGCLFAFESSVSLETIETHYRTALGTHGLGPHIDLILILDRAVFTLAVKMPSQSWGPAFLEGRSPGTEGAHIAIGRQDLGELALDGFLRFLLAQLVVFRGIVDHPGFKPDPEGQIRLSYLTSITFERDPARKSEILRQYKDEVLRDFVKHPIPPPTEPA